MAEVQPLKKDRKAEAKPSKSKQSHLQQDPDSAKHEEIFSDLQKKIEGRFQSMQGRKKSFVNSPKTIKSLGKHSEPNGELSKDVGPRGKKRDSLGTVLNRKKSGQQAAPQKVLSKETTTLKQVDPALQEEVLALGGTAEDLKLLDGVDSDSEVDGSKPTGTKAKGKDIHLNGLEKGMSNILREIALAQGQGPPSESSESLDGDSEDADGLSELGGAPMRQEPTPTKPILKPAHIGSTGLKFEPRPDWFRIQFPEVDLTKQPKYTLSQQSLSQLHDHARLLLDSENEAYRQKQQKSSSQSFYHTVITSGTLSDKISALTLAVQDSPVHNIKALETLIGLAKKRSRAQAVDVLRALKDLFAQGSLLPSDRKLHPFASQPVLIASFAKTKAWNSGDPLPPGLEEGHLIAWAFENWLKEQYFEVLKTLEIWCNDEIEFSKSRAVSFVFELLKEKPEQESNLLRLLINKIGDPVKKIASQTSYLIMQLLSAHPAMKGTVISAIEADFIFRPGQSLHGKYYAAVTLNQTALSSQEQEVAVKLLDIYFGLFVALLKSAEHKPVEHKTAAPKDEDGDDGLTRGQQRRHKHKLKKSNSQAGDGQEVDLREKVISAVLTGVNRAYPYADKDGHDLGSHLDTLFKITHSSNFNTSIQAMMLIQQMSSSHQTSADRFYRTLYESLLDPRLVASSKQQLYLNLLHRALKADLNLKRVKAFVKRILQILTLHEPSFICGSFFLLSDLQNTFPGLKALLDQPEDHESDDEEVFQDVKDEPAPEEHSFIHPDRRNTATDPPDPNAYNPRKRDPEHSNAQNSCAWDLLPFLAHFHPSVTASADHLLRHAKLPGKPDLTLHSLSHFLDRFVYRNPKLASTNLRGSSIMQPMASDDMHAVLISTSAASRGSLPVNSEQFKSQKGAEVAADDVFFHQYFNGLNQEPTKKKSQKMRDAAEGGDGSEEDEEDEVWKAMIDSAPALEGDNDSDEGLDFSDLESDFDAEDDEEGDEMSDSEAQGTNDDAVAGEILDGSDEKMGGFEHTDNGVLEDDDEAEAAALLAVSRKKTHGKDGQRVPSTSKERKRKMKALPTFASASDYAKMIGGDTDEDMG